MRMRAHHRAYFLFSPDTLDLKVSPTSLSLGAAMAVPEASTLVEAGDDDPLPGPEPEPDPYPGVLPLPDHPELPPSGPVGPGLS